MTRILAACLLALTLSACAGTRDKPFGATFAGGESKDGCSWYLADGKERTGTTLSGTVCGGRITLRQDESRAFQGQAQALAAQQALVDGVRAAVMDGLRVGLALARPGLRKEGVDLPPVGELVPPVLPVPEPEVPAPGGAETDGLGPETPSELAPSSLAPSSLALPPALEAPEPRVQEINSTRPPKDRLPERFEDDQPRVERIAAPAVLMLPGSMPLPAVPLLLVADARPLAELGPVARPRVLKATTVAKPVRGARVVKAVKVQPKRGPRTGRA